MTRVKKIILRVLLFLIISTVVGIVVLNKMLSPDLEKLTQEFHELGFEITESMLPTDAGNIASYRTGNPTKQKLLFVHGSPGDWTAWQEQFKDSLLQANFDMLAYDRPGFGKTSVNASQSLKTQSNIVIKIMNQFPLDTFILVGHSYGGAVIEQTAIDHPDLIKHIIYVTPTLEPAAQNEKWFNQVGKVFYPLLSSAWKSSNYEMMGLQQELIRNEEFLSTIIAEATWLMGGKDFLVPATTLTYYQNKTEHKLNALIDDEANHFIPWEQSSWLNEVILHTLNTTSTDRQ